MRHDLAQLLIHGVHRRLGSALDASRESSKRACLCSPIHCAGPQRIMLWVAPEIWLREERGVQPVPPCVAVVHMVRDPARWALSFYDYHRQKQQPRDERWVYRYRPRCALPHEQYQRALEPFGLSAELLNATLAACRALVWADRSLHEHFSPLRLSEPDGARLAAFMNVLSGPHLVEAGGDMLRAAVNALALRRMPVT